MPELPEVHTISSDLKNTVKNWTITDVQIMGTYKVLPSNEVFLKHLPGQKIIDITRIAKNITINLSSGNHLIIHLAMTGQVLIRKPEHKPDNWVRVLFKATNGNENVQIRFCDMRMFGKVALVNDKGLQKLKDKYGQEPIQQDASAEELFKKLKSKRTTIKNALLDQSIVSGLGNIYATDALFLAKIHPETSTKDVTLVQAQKLLETASTILKEGIEHRGSTLSDRMYVDAFGKEGSHQNYFRIYSKAICPNCSTKTLFKKINGRGTYFCPTCQPLNGELRLL